MKAENGLKKCSKCGEVKGVEEYHKSKQTADGFMCHCKLCRKSVCDAWTLRNPDKVKQTAYLYRLNNKEKIKNADKKWVSNNRDYINKKSKEWKSKNKDKVVAARKIYNLTYPEILRAQSRRKTANLNTYIIKTYIRKSFGLCLDDITPIMIELKRTQLLNKRLIKNLKENETE